MPLLAILAIGIVIILAWVKQVNQYERGLVFTMGRYSKTWEPGWHVLVPIFQRMIKVDIRTRAVDVPEQETITRDNIPVHINAVFYFKIVNPEKAIVEVDDYLFAVTQLAQVTMRNAVGEVKLDELLAKKDQISAAIQKDVDHAAEEWGVDVQRVELKDIVLPDTLKRTLAKVAEAEREKQAVVISSEGELAASENVAKAAEMLAKTPGALHLRTLQSINDISSDDSNTTVWMVPVEVLKAIEGFTKK